jgi:Spy/CpxP family protein refolding chaperone
MGNTWKVVVAFVGVFIAGTVFGGFFALGVGQRVIQSRRPPPPINDPGLLQRYVDRLELNEEQKTKIKPILDKAQTDVNEIRRQATMDTAAVILPIVQKAEVDLKKLLTPEQVAKLGDIEKNRALSIDPQGGRGGRGGGPPGGGFNRGGPQNGPGGFSPNRGDGSPGGQNGPGGKGQRGPSGQGFNPGDSRGGAFPRPSPDARPTTADSALPKSPVPVGN